MKKITKRLQAMTFRKTFEARFKEHGENKRIVANIRFDDECGNGHNSFAITGDIYAGKRFESGGCIHEEIEKYFPELKKYIKWHLVSSDGPMHYVANTVYWAKERNLKNARESAIWPKATKKQLQNKVELEKRLPELMVEFEKDMIKLKDT